ncbi:MAG: hypothetical protein ABSC61_00455 [Anaerolineales bacterium]
MNIALMHSSTPHVVGGVGSVLVHQARHIAGAGYSRPRSESPRRTME